MGEPSAEELRRFYDERSKPNKRDRFRFDKQGNLAEYDKKGKLVKTIVLPTYRPPTEEEMREMEKERFEKMVVANRTFEDARKRLFQAIQEQTVTRSEIVELNREVRDADIILQSVRFPLRGISTDLVKIKDLDFDQLQETRKYPYDIAFSEVRPYTLQQQYVRVGDIPLPQMVSVTEAKRAEAQVETIILFSDQDMETSPYGFLALSWPAAIPFHDKSYASARHAIFAELATEFGDVEQASAIQATDTATDIRYTLDDVAGGREVNQMKWNTTLSRLIDAVNLVKFKQYPELAQRLMELPSPLVIGAVEPNDLQIGIGMSMNNVKAKDKLSWTGENWLGKALVTIRENLIAERAQLAAQSMKKPKKVQPIITTTSTGLPATPGAPPMAPPMAQMVQPTAPATVAPIAVQMASVAPVSAPAVAPSIRRGPRIAPKVQPSIAPQ